jgi:hypothetical protein
VTAILCVNVVRLGVDGFRCVIAILFPEPAEAL